jgi:hypothetical protein
MKVDLSGECLAAILSAMIGGNAGPLHEFASPKGNTRMTTFSTSRQLAATPAAVFGAMKDLVRLAK